MELSRYMGEVRTTSRPMDDVTDINGLKSKIRKTTNSGCFAASIKGLKKNMLNVQKVNVINVDAVASRESSAREK
jgi:hypothetical protein